MLDNNDMGQQSINRALLSSGLTWETWANEIGLRILVQLKPGGKSYELPW